MIKIVLLLKYINTFIWQCAIFIFMHVSNTWTLYLFGFKTVFDDGGYLSTPPGQPGEAEETGIQSSSKLHYFYHAIFTSMQPCLN